jgi:peptidoglycan hydrolase-like protein with peptidoglycan-binding domain
VPPALPAAGITLKPGASGAPVRLLQLALATLGYSPGKVDGQYGPSTQQALIRFQRAAHLAPDGVFGPKTRTALAQALQAHQ